MPTFRAPMINLYSRDLSRAAAFYSELGFVESFRTPESGEPVHIELALDGFTLGIATNGAPLLSPAHDFLDGKLRCLDR